MDKVKGKKKSVISRGVARIFSWGTHSLLNTPPLPPPPQIWKLLLRVFFIIFFRLIGPNLSKWPRRLHGGVIPSERVVDVGGSGWILPRKILKNPAKFRKTLRSAFCWQFRSVIECVSHHTESDKDESLSVSELELLVELPIAFDFCSSCCFMFIVIFCFNLFVCFQKPVRWVF